MAHNDKFREDFAVLIQKAGDNLTQLVRAVPLQLASSIIQRSPVDTGRFKGNWFTAVGNFNTTTTTDTDKTGQTSLNRTQTVVRGFEVGQTIFITNSLPYAIPLEHGHSGQAPQGMVKLAVAEYVTKVEALANKIRSQS